MKNMRRIFTVFIAAVMCMNVVTACNKDDVKKIGEPEYKAVSGFYYSSDNGHTYGDGTKEYSVGKTVYMKVKFKVISNKKKASTVNVVLSIPNIESVDAQYLDGQVIKPEYDAKNNVTSYTFTASASKEPEEQECVIQFIPKAVGSFTMTLVFDDNIDPSYDSQSTLVFVEEQDSELDSELDSNLTTEPTPTPTLAPTSTPEPTPTPEPTESAQSESSSAESSDSSQTSETKTDN